MEEQLYNVRCVPDGSWLYDYERGIFRHDSYGTQPIPNERAQITLDQARKSHFNNSPEGPYTLVKVLSPEFLQLVGGACNFHPIPARVLDSLCEFEANRTGEPHDDIARQIADAFSAYTPTYVTDSPGFVGEVVLVLWRAHAGAVTIWSRARGGEWKIEHESPI